LRYEYMLQGRPSGRPCYKTVILSLHRPEHAEGSKDDDLAITILR
jgi:hypothetical protein